MLVLVGTVDSLASIPCLAAPPLATLGEVVVDPPMATCVVSPAALNYTDVHLKQNVRANIKFRFAYLTLILSYLY
jgi:hypothetical protein